MVEKDQESRALDKRPAGLPPEHRRGKNNRSAQALRERFRGFLNNDFDRLKERIVWLSEHATDDHKQQVRLICKLIDKLAPDQRADMEGASQGGGARIVIQNIPERLTNAKVIDVEAESAD